MSDRFGAKYRHRRQVYPEGNKNNTIEEQTHEPVWIVPDINLDPFATTYKGRQFNEATNTFEVADVPFPTSLGEAGQSNFIPNPGGIIEFTNNTFRIVEDDNNTGDGDSTDAKHDALTLIASVEDIITPNDDENLILTDQYVSFHSNKTTATKERDPKTGLGDFINIDFTDHTGKTPHNLIRGNAADDANSFTNIDIPVNVEFNYTPPKNSDGTQSDPIQFIVGIIVSVTGWNNQDRKFADTIRDEDGNVIHLENDDRPEGDYKNFDEETGDTTDSGNANTSVNTIDEPYTGDDIPDFADIDNDNDNIFDPIETQSQLGIFNNLGNNVNLEHDPINWQSGQGNDLNLTDVIFNHLILTGRFNFVGSNLTRTLFKSLHLRDVNDANGNTIEASLLNFTGCRLHQARFISPKHMGQLIDTLNDFNEHIKVGTNFNVIMHTVNDKKEFEILFKNTELKTLYQGKRRVSQTQYTPYYQVLNLSSLFGVVQFMENYGQIEGNFQAYKGYGTTNTDGTSAVLYTTATGTGKEQTEIKWSTATEEQKTWPQGSGGIVYSTLVDYMQARYGFNVVEDGNSYNIEIDTEGTGVTTIYTGALITFQKTEYTRGEFEELTNIEVLTVADDINYDFVQIITNAQFHSANIEPGRIYFLTNIDETFDLEGVGLVTTKDQASIRQLAAEGKDDITGGSPGTHTLMKFQNVSVAFYWGSTLMYAAFKVISQTVSMNTYETVTLTLPRKTVLGLTNLSPSAFDYISEVRVSLENNVPELDIEQNGQTVNTASVTQEGSNYTVKLATTAPCTFNVVVSVTLNSVNTNDLTDPLLFNKVQPTVFSGVVQVEAQYLRGMGITLGDPHITTIYGTTYELPYVNGIYRLLQGNNLRVNASTRKLTAQEGKEIKAYYKKVTKRTPPKSLITSGVVYDRIIVFYKKSVFNFSFSKDTIQSIGDEILVLNKHSFRIHDEELGEIVMKFKFLDNPQEKYGIELHCEKNKKLSGLLINEYIASSMRVKTLLNKEHKTGILGKNEVISKVDKVKKAK
jgi:hypothetical protein